MTSVTLLFNRIMAFIHRGKRRQIYILKTAFAPKNIKPTQSTQWHCHIKKKKKSPPRQYEGQESRVLTGRTFGFECQWHLSAGAQQGLEKLILLSWGMHIRTHKNCDTAHSNTSIRIRVDLTRALGDLLGEYRLSVAHCGDKNTGSGGPREYQLAWALPEVPILAPSLGPTQ